ncbi:hypothetical protein D4764_08G0010020 [Takifugu flavidus]|uniref:Uncharacterized protein n=1 Tax=Takifugu flavidus TaxID=433684 RepID=A0A5C6MQH5_9TELE|nr:hypothetical protein D4764_08G0010020 [Takifugu flavidus]
MEVEGLDDNLNKQLMRMKDFSKNTNLISELEKQLHSFQDSVKSTHENELRKMSKDKKKYKLLKEQLKDVQKLLCSHQINAEKIQTKISGLHEKERALDFNLIELNSLTLKKQGKIG